HRHPRPQGLPPLGARRHRRALRRGQGPLRLGVRRARRPRGQERRRDPAPRSREAQALDQPDEARAQRPQEPRQADLRHPIQEPVMLASVSVDLDPIACYYKIHALGPHPAALAEIVLRRAVPRYLEIFARHGVRATFFVVGSDLSSPSARALVRDIAAAHEVANHSFSHHDDLARRRKDQIADEIQRADDVIAAAAGASLSGFRAPGYDVSAEMLEIVAGLGYVYDSSIFPAPGYYVAK